MKAKQVVVVTPTARERFTAARPMIIIVVFSLLFVIVASMLPKAGYNNAPVGIRNKEGDGARALAQVLGNLKRHREGRLTLTLTGKVHLDGQRVVQRRDAVRGKLHIDDRADDAGDAPLGDCLCISHGVTPCLEGLSSR